MSPESISSTSIEVADRVLLAVELMALRPDMHSIQAVDAADEMIRTAERLAAKSASKSRLPSRRRE